MQTAAELDDGVAALPPFAEGTRLGVWSIRSRLGAGGMGDVYLAERADGLYGQVVAIKVLRQIHPSATDRFERERRRLAQMSHPGISRIIDGGTAVDGRPYMVMEYVEGDVLDRYVQSRSLSVRQILTLFAALCRAVAYAHSKLVLHRDIKPANVLVGADGQPRLLDFGIATVLDEEDAQPGVMTLSHAAPEQLLGGALTVAVDVFALGLVLHQLVCGVLPERQADMAVRVALERLPDAELGALVRKATAAAPDERYASVQALLDDVEAYLRHRPLRALAGGWAYRSKKFLQRNPWQSSLAAALVLAVVSGLLTSMRLTQRAEHEAALARSEAARANENLARSEFFLAQSRLYHTAQDAYSDVLQRVFGDSTDIERQTQLLLDRWREAWQRRMEEPDQAALLSYAIGRHFLFRNDYPTALQVLEPWIDEAYGPSELVDLGAQLLPVLYINLGRPLEAVPLLRDSVNRYASGYDANSPDHVAQATQLATITADPADVVAAETLLRRAMAEDHGPQLAMYFANQLARMQRLRGDLAAALVTLREMVVGIEANALLDISGTDTGRLNLAYFELFEANNPARAEALARHVLDDTARQRGLSREAGRAQELLGLIAALRGDQVAAEAALREAVVLTERFGGTQSLPRLAALLSLVEWLCDRDRLDEAAVLLTQARQDQPAQDALGEVAASMQLAEARLLLAQQGPAALRRHLEARPVNLRVLATDPGLSTRYRRLTDGDLPTWPGS